MSRAYIHQSATRGERWADAIADRMGSWGFIGIQSGIVAVWVGINLVGLAVLRWDPYPFILLNLLFSTQAAYAAPVIMMSQNRQASRDRVRDDHEAEEVDALHGMARELLTLQRQQMEILTVVHEMHPLTPGPSPSRGEGEIDGEEPSVWEVRLRGSGAG